MGESRSGALTLASREPCPFLWPWCLWLFTTALLLSTGKRRLQEDPECVNNAKDNDAKNGNGTARFW